MILAVSLVVVLGLAFGSFLGACVYRIPRGISVIRPASFCPHCKAGLAWRDLVPIVSQVLNRSQCRMCGVRISLKYPAIEVTTAAIFAALFLTCGDPTQLPGRCVFALTLIPLIWIDWEHLVIPNGILIAGAAATLILHLAFSPAEILAHAFSAAAALSAMMLVRLVAGVLLGRPALGMGDVKLCGFVTLQLGPAGFLVALWLGAVGALAAAGLSKRRIPDRAALGSCGAVAASGDAIPFGSFLSAASILVMILSTELEAIWAAWLTLMP
jgi:leader peptidase (prepilin peptidase)/N-methyltransferase